MHWLQQKRQSEYFEVNQENEQEQNDYELNFQRKGGIDLFFTNISYSVPITDKENASGIPCFQKDKKKLILKNLSGIFKAGECTAIMGPSGAGKTSLLNILACRLNANQGGKVYANSVQMNSEIFGNFANYVMQQDALMQTLTVKQTLQFALKFRSDESQKQRNNILKRTIKMFKLEKCLDTLVGGCILKGISGGQKKRVSIAFQLLSDPQILILDEPTSGLDSLTSQFIVYELRKLARTQNKTIIMTIHQPNSDIFNLFDRLILLSKGTLVYQGKASKCIQYFEQKLNILCPKYMNPAQLLIQMVQNLKQQALKFYDKSFNMQLKNYTQNLNKKLVPIARQTNRHFWPGVEALIKRNYLNTIRNPRLIRSKILLIMFLSIYIGGLYFGIAHQDLNQIQSWRAFTGFNFCICINAMHTVLNPTAISFPAERQVFYKQEHSRLYNTLQYFLAKNIVEIPELLIIPLMSVTLYYFMVGLSVTLQQFLFHWMIYFLISLFGSSVGIFLGCAITDPKTVSTTLPILTLPFILFAGVYKNRQDYPPWIGWLEYLSPIKYGLIGLLNNELKVQNQHFKNMHYDVNKTQSIGLLILISLSVRILSFFILWWTRKTL